MKDKKKLVITIVIIAILVIIVGVALLFTVREVNDTKKEKKESSIKQQVYEVVKESCNCEITDLKITERDEEKQEYTALNKKTETDYNKDYYIVNLKTKTYDLLSGGLRGSTDEELED